MQSSRSKIVASLHSYNLVAFREKFFKKKKQKNKKTNFHEMLPKFIQLPAQLLPFPVYPTRQLQVYEPSVLLQSALVSHSFVSGLAHSSISVSKMGRTIKDK